MSEAGRTPSPAPIVTLDGPAGSGKSTTAREVARRLGFRHLDSGALYRALTFALLEAGRPPDTWPALGAEEIAGLGVSVRAGERGFDILLGERVLGAELRTETVTAGVSPLARLPAVRAALLGIQRAAGHEGRLVADGRDMGSVVFPDAVVKVFLLADLEVRARRRLRESGREESAAALAREVEAIAARDRRDSERELSPLRRPDDAVELDTTRLSFEEQVEAVVALVLERTRAGPSHVDAPEADR